MSQKREDQYNLTSNDYNDSPEYHQQSYPSTPQYGQPSPYTSNPQYGQPNGYPYPQPPAYSPQIPAPPAVQQVSTNTTTVVVGNQTPYIYVADYLAWSIISIFFCNPLLGIIATVFSAIARDYRWSGNIEGARKHARVAMWLNISSILVHVITVIVLVAVLVSNSHKQIEEEYTYRNQYYDESTASYYG